jgi:hypothetical protein
MKPQRNGGHSKGLETEGSSKGGGGTLLLALFVMVTKVEAVLYGMGWMIKVRDRGRFQLNFRLLI